MQSRLARVFDFPNQGPVGVFGCAFQGARAYRLSARFGTTYRPLVEPAVWSLNDVNVAYSFTDHVGGLAQLDWLRVRNLATGRVLHTIRGVLSDAASRVGVDAGFSRVVLVAGGSVAWIAYAENHPGAPGLLWPDVAVGVADQNGQRTLDRSTPLDSSGPIDIRSLRLSSGVLTWTRNGAPSTAPFG